MGSWLSMQDFEEFNHINSSNQNNEYDKSKAEKIKMQAYYRKMEHKSPREIYQLANSLYFGRYHPDNTKQIIDTRGAAIYYKQAYEKLLKYIQTLEIAYDSDDY